MSNNIRKYKLIPGINVDLETGEVVKGYYVEKAIVEGDRTTSFFVQGSMECAIAHIRRTHGIIDKARLIALSKFLEEDTENLDIEEEKE